MFLGKTFKSRSASSTQEYEWVLVNCQRSLIKWEGGGGKGKFAMYWPLIQGVVLVLLVASCLGNRDKVRLDGPLGLSTDFTFSVLHCIECHSR